MHMLSQHVMELSTCMFIQHTKATRAGADQAADEQDHNPKAAHAGCVLLLSSKPWLGSQQPMGCNLVVLAQTSQYWQRLAPTTENNRSCTKQLLCVVHH